MNDLGLYLHMPFCVRKCRYCDFLSAPADEQTRQLYAAAMKQDMKGYGDTLKGHPVSTVFLGGGTPSLMPVRSLRQIFRTMYETFQIERDAEVTMEINPGTLSEACLSFVSESVNRVSLGVQSAVDSELRMLGRIHTRADAEKSIRLLRSAGITNINLDLMSGIPNQTLDSWCETLNWAVSTGVPHISAYSLIIEEGTPFYEQYQAGQLALPDEETEREMYYRTQEILERAGIHRYEISNYAKDGFECRHNVRYWTRGDYIGFGIGAASLYRHKRWNNTDSLENYLADAGHPERLVCNLESLDKKAEIEEFLFLGLRMTEGVSEGAFRDAFGLEIGDVYQEQLDRLTAEQLLVHDGDRYALTARGIDVSNRVLSEFLLD